MKTKNILSLILFLMISSIVFGLEPKPKIKAKKIDNLEKHISSKITYPAEYKSEKIEGFVLVTFSINSDGILEVEAVNSSNEELKDFVKTELESIRLCPFDVSSGKTFNYKFVFELL